MKSFVKVVDAVTDNRVSRLKRFKQQNNDVPAQILYIKRSSFNSETSLTNCSTNNRHINSQRKEVASWTEDERRQKHIYVNYGLSKYSNSAVDLPKSSDGRLTYNQWVAVLSLDMLAAKKRKFDSYTSLTEEAIQLGRKAPERKTGILQQTEDNKYYKAREHSYPFIKSSQKDLNTTIASQQASYFRNVQPVNRLSRISIVSEVQTKLRRFSPKSLATQYPLENKSIRISVPISGTHSQSPKSKSIYFERANKCYSSTNKLNYDEGNYMIERQTQNALHLKRKSVSFTSLDLIDKEESSKGKNYINHQWDDELHSDSTGDSTVQTDSSNFIVLKKSDDYLPRQSTLKFYKPAQSQTTQNMIVRAITQESGESSISTLKHTDISINSHLKSRDGVDRDGIMQWLDKRQTNRRTSVTDKSHYTVIHIRPNYEALFRLAGQFSLKGADMCLANESLQNLKKASITELPIPLRPGRIITLKGHFLFNLDLKQYSIIRLSPVVIDNEDESRELDLRVWSDGGLDILKPMGTAHKFITGSSIFNYSAFKTDQLSFVLKLIERDGYCAISANDLFTLIVPKEICFDQLRLFKIKGGSNAQLDHLTVSKNIILPFTVKLKTIERSRLLINLNTEFTSTSERMFIKLLPTQSLSDECILVELNFLQNRLSVTHHGTIQSDVGQCGIPLKSEQIKLVELNLDQHLQKGFVKVYINKNCLLEYEIPDVSIMKQLQRICINGDLTLLNMELL